MILAPIISVFLENHTIIIVLRTDVFPNRIVAYVNLVRMPYPDMFAIYTALVERYQADAAHDATGLGTVADDYVEEQTIDVSLVGVRRTSIFSEYIVAIENEEIVGPRIAYMYSEHKYVTAGDLFEGKGHPPDSFIAGALAWYAAKQPPIIR